MRSSRVLDAWHSSNSRADAQAASDVVLVGVLS